MSNSLAIFYFLKSEFHKDPDRWFSVREVASVIDLSIDRTRKHLSLLVMGGDAQTKIDGWSNVYKYRCGR